MASAGTVTVDFAAETAKFTAEVKKVRQDISRIREEVSGANRVIQNFGSAIVGIVSVAAISTAVRAVVDATAEAERSVALLNNALASTNANVSAASADLQAWASELQRTTTFSDDAIMGVETLLLSFQGLSGDVVKRATAAVLDLSTRMGIDAPSAAKLLGRALSDPEKGMTALTRAGVTFSEQQRNQIEALVTGGKAAEAHGLILAELERRFGGAAQAARNTLGGALEGLKNNFGDLLEVSTGVPGVVQQINELSDVLADPRTKAAADSLFGGMITAATAAARAISAIAGEITAFADNLSTLGSNDRTDALRAQIDFLQQMVREGTSFVSLGVGRFKDVGTGYFTAAEGAARLLDLQRQLNDELAAVAVENAPRGPLTRRPAQDFTTGGTQEDDGAEQMTDEQIRALARLNQLQIANARKLNEESFAIIDEYAARRLEFETNVAEQIQAGRIAMERETAEAARQIAQEGFQAYMDEAQRRIELERSTQEQIQQIRSGAINAGIGLLQVLSTRSKSAAKALILVNRGLAIAQAVQNTAAAATKALAIYGPTPQGFAAAAAAKAWGAVQIGLIAATGALEVGAVNSGNGSSVVGPGTPHNPIFTQNGDEDRQFGADARPSVQLFVTGYIGREQVDQMIAALQDEIGARDVVIIPPGSRQAQELREA